MVYRNKNAGLRDEQGCPAETKAKARLCVLGQFAPGVVEGTSQVDSPTIQRVTTCKHTKWGNKRLDATQPFHYKHTREPSSWPGKRFDVIWDKLKLYSSHTSNSILSLSNSKRQTGGSDVSPPAAYIENHLGQDICHLTPCWDPSERLPTDDATAPPLRLFIDHFPKCCDVDDQPLLARRLWSSKAMDAVIQRLAVSCQNGRPPS